MSSSSSSCSLLPVGPLQASSSSSPPRGRRPRRVLYPSCQSRRPRQQEAPDRAGRCLLLLAALVFLQIYSEETLSGSELQTQSQDAAPPPQEAEGGRGEEPWRVQVGGGASETQLECVVA